MSHLEENFERLFYAKILQLHSTIESFNSKDLRESQRKAVNEHVGKLLSKVMAIIPENDGPTAGRTKVEVSKSDEVELAVSGMSKYFLRNAETILNGYQQYLIEPVKARQRITFENVTKPQLLFKDKIDNRNNTAFVPKLTKKYNASTIFCSQSNGRLGATSEHPYLQEIEASALPSRFGSTTEELGKISLSSVDNITEVNNLGGLKSMIEELRKQKIFSFDLHNHSFRSFMGFVCFLEISTPNKNFLVDALVLREHLEELNEVFTDARIVKIGYETRDKVLWLQRDFGIYIVGLIDLDILLKSLKIPSSLAFLAPSFLNLNIGSLYAEFDFRRRPISNKEKLYLGSFSWAILGIFVKVVSFPNSIEYVNNVFAHSKKLTAKTFSKELYAPEILQAKFVNDVKDELSPTKFFKMTKLLAWRDETARTQDESYEYILPNSLLRALVVSPPRDIDSLRLVCQQHFVEISSEYIESIFAIIQEKPSLYDKKAQQEINDKGTELINSLFTPSRDSVSKLIPGSDNESPAYDQAELHKLIDWNSGTKASTHSEFTTTNTPVRKYDDIIQRTVLTPSIFKDSPSEDNREDIHHLLNILNGRNDIDLVRSEISKFALFSCKKSEQPLMPTVKDTEDNLAEIVPYINVKEEIPGTIEEIYEIGNNIRKKNKAKKKKEVRPRDQENMTPTNKGLKFQSPNVKEETNLKFLLGEKTQNPSKAGQSSDQILYELGWL